MRKHLLIYFYKLTLRNQSKRLQPGSQDQQKELWLDFKSLPPEMQLEIEKHYFTQLDLTKHRSLMLWMVMGNFFDKHVIPYVDQDIAQEIGRLQNDIRAEQGNIIRVLQNKHLRLPNEEHRPLPHDNQPAQAAESIPRQIAAQDGGSAAGAPATIVTSEPYKANPQHSAVQKRRRDEMEGSAQGGPASSEQQDKGKQPAVATGSAAGAVVNAKQQSEQPRRKQRSEQAVGATATPVNPINMIPPTQGVASTGSAYAQTAGTEPQPMEATSSSPTNPDDGHGPSAAGSAAGAPATTQHALNQGDSRTSGVNTHQALLPYQENIGSRETTIYPTIDPPKQTNKGVVVETDGNVLSPKTLRETQKLRDIVTDRKEDDRYQLKTKLPIPTPLVINNKSTKPMLKKEYSHPDITDIDSLIEENDANQEFKMLSQLLSFIPNINMNKASLSA